MDCRRGVVVGEEMLKGMTPRALSTLLRYCLDGEGGDLGAHARSCNLDEDEVDEVLRWSAGILLVAVPGSLMGPPDVMRLMEASRAKTAQAVARAESRGKKAKAAHEGSTKKLEKRELVGQAWETWSGAWIGTFPNNECRRWGVKDKELVAGWTQRDGYKPEDVLAMLDRVVRGWEVIKKRYKNLVAEVPTIPLVHGYREDFIALTKKGEVKAAGEWSADGELPEAWRE